SSVHSPAAASTHQLYTLSLHDALPIWAIVEDTLKESGQLFRDLIDMGNNEGTKKILVLPPHAKGREAEVLEAIFDGAESPGTKSDRKSTRLNSSHVKNSYAVSCLKKKK